MHRQTAFIRTTLFLFLVGASALRLTAGSGGSAYSIFGVGDLRYATGLRSMGMGYTGLALPGASAINGYSPASWSRINRVRLEASILYEGFSSTDASRSRFLARTDFSGALLAVPISQEHGITITGGFLPFSTVNYDAYTQGSALTPRDTLQYSVHNVGSGGITRGLIGLSYAPSTNLSLGFSVDALFGTNEALEAQIPTSAKYAGGELTRRITTSGLAFTFGTLYTGLGTVIPALSPVSLGATITTRSTLSSRDLTTYRFTNSESSSERDTSAELARSTTIPLSFGLGIGLQLNDRLLCALDYVSQGWAGALVNDREQESLRNSRRIGIGFERVPSREPYASGFEHLALRFGAYYHSTYYQPNGEPINEWGITGGVGLPFSGDSRLNLALEYAERGTTAKGLVKDQIIRLSASLNISALWFVQFPED